MLERFPTLQGANARPAMHLFGIIQQFFGVHPVALFVAGDALREAYAV